MSDAPKHYWIYRPKASFSNEPYLRTHPVGDFGESRVTVTSGPEWYALMERALEARRLITDSPVAWNAQDVLRDLLAYFEEPRDE